MSCANRRAQKGGLAIADLGKCCILWTNASGDEQTSTEAHDSQAVGMLIPRGKLPDQKLREPPGPFRIFAGASKDPMACKEPPIPAKNYDPPVSADVAQVAGKLKVLTTPRSSMGTPETGTVSKKTRELPRISRIYTMRSVRATSKS